MLGAMRIRGVTLNRTPLLLSACPRLSLSCAALSLSGATLRSSHGILLVRHRGSVFSTPMLRSWSQHDHNGALEGHS